MKDYLSLALAGALSFASNSPLVSNEKKPENSEVEQSAPIAGSRSEEKGEEQKKTTSRSFDHWSYLPLSSPSIPDVKDVDWCANGIDRFILSKLESKGLRPSPAAARATLLRRLTLDLHGLTPSRAEIEAFEGNPSPLAYDQKVLQLLDSQHYAERWTRHWLDQARYADSHGYDMDQGRPHAWRYREWVLKALHRDMPFDQFTIEQIAGDLLPDSTVEQKVATGFHRNSLHNSEAGADPEEDRIRQTLDRTNTIATVWLGMTLGCAQCHDHKYDPVSQKEYFRFYAFMNGVQDTDVVAPTPEDIRDYETKLPIQKIHIEGTTSLRTRYENSVPADAQQKWEESLPKAVMGRWIPITPLDAAGSKGEEIAPQEDGSLLVKGPLADDSTYTLTFTPDVDTITALRLEVLPHDSLPHRGPGRAPNGHFGVANVTLRVEPNENEFLETSQQDQQSYTMSLVYPVASYSAPNRHVSNAVRNASTGTWSTGDEGVGKRHVAVFELHVPLVDVKKKRLVISMKQGGSAWMQNLGCFRLSVSDTPTPFLVEEIPHTVAATLQVAADKRTEEQKRDVREYFFSRDPIWLQLNDVIEKRKEYAPKHPNETKAYVVAAPEKPVVTRIFEKGDFVHLADEVQPGTPECLPPLEVRGETPDRLDLARWIASPKNPLTARVVVNRVWQKYFGRGLVVTDDDFGLLGTEPSNPELLDWLAGEFIRSGWSLKALHRLIVTSSTYQQSSVLRPDLLDIDPQNEWLARQSRLRLDAEIVRDVTLAASGLLFDKFGGRSVVLPQPIGTEDLAFNRSAPLKPDWGKPVFRRSLYVWHQRTAPFPMFNIFDGPNGNLTCTRRERSNTPMQALVRLNDPWMYESARVMAKKLMEDVPGFNGDEKTVNDRIDHLFFISFSRRPSSDERAEFSKLREDLDKFYDTYPHLAQQIGGRFVKEDEPISLTELATWAVLCRITLNLEEFICRE